jgi:hypothetical protein
MDYHIIPNYMCGLPYNSHRYEKYMGQPSVDYVPYNSQIYGKYMGQPSVDYHIIPIDMESIWDNEVWTTI